MSERDKTVPITGAAGRIGTMLRARLTRPGRTLSLLDIATPADPGDGEEVRVAPVTDRDAFAGVRAVVHLGGISGEADRADSGAGDARRVRPAP